MEERPDHLVTFHVVLPLEDAHRPGPLLLAAGRRPRIFHRLRIRRQRRDHARSRRRPAARPPSPSPRRWWAKTAKTLSESFFTGLRAGSEFRLQDGQPRNRGLPVKRILRALPFRAALALALLATRAAPALAQLAHRPFEVGGGEGGGGANGGVTGWLLAEQSQLTHLIAAHVKALHGDPAAMWGLVGIGFAYGVFHAAGPGTRQGGDRLLHDGQRSRAEARRRPRLSRGAVAGLGRGRAGRRRGADLQRHVV